MVDWRAFYRKYTNPFRSKGPFYSGPGHHGVDFACAPHGDIPAYFTGTLVKNGHTSVIGNYSVYRRADGMHAGFAHLLVGTRRDVGDRVEPGDSVGKASTWGDDTGSAWRGAHCHTTVSGFVDGIWDGRVIDPWPSIKRYVTAAASSSAKPVKQVTYTVRRGDTLTRVAAKYNTTVKRLLALNTIDDEDHIWVGQKVRVK